MGFFDSKWIVEFEYSEGFLSSTKKATMVVEASSEYSAKDKAKSVLRANHKYVRILSAHKSGGKDEEKKTTYKPSYTTYSSPKVETVSKPASLYSSVSEERTYNESPEERAIRMAEIERDIKQRKIEEKQKEIAQIKSRPIRFLIVGIFLTLLGFGIGWIPRAVAKAKEAWQQEVLDAWLEWGHSATDATGKELTQNIRRFHSAANTLILVPILVLVVGIFFSVFIYIRTKKNVPTKLAKAQKELEDLNSK